MKMRSGTRAIDKIYKRRDRYEIPDWQRSKVWPKKKKQKLIDTILRGWKLPKFYFLKVNHNPEEFEVLDGQQRLTAIWEFFDDELELSKESEQEFGAKRYSELSDDLSDAFDDYEIEYDQITDAAEEDQKEFFQRLQEGLPLTTSEKLNSVHGKLRDFCVDIVDHPFFAETISVSNKRHGHLDIAAKAVAIELSGLDQSLRYNDIKSLFEQHAAFSKNSEVARRIVAAISLLHGAFPQNSRVLRNRTIVQSVITLTCHLNRSGMEKSKSSKLSKFIDSFFSELSKQVELGQDATDQDYIAFQRTVNANVRSGANIRQSVLIQKLLHEYPAFFSPTILTTSIQTSLETSVRNTASALQQKVVDVNAIYAAKNGKDLFKQTNKTTEAFGVIGKPIRSQEACKKLFEHLYFIFKEGPGQRLASSNLPSIAYVNDIRTYFEHDIDHGKGKSVRSKRAKIAKTFEELSGSKSPETLDPSAFLVLQGNILRRLLDDLKTLSF